jgi:hypothetical protein
VSAAIAKPLLAAGLSHNTNKMNLEEAKNQTAIIYKFESWKDLKSKLSAEDVLPFFNDAADLYAKSKWEEACQLQINSCLDNLRPTFADSLAYGDVASAPKPQFVP